MEKGGGVVKGGGMEGRGGRKEGERGVRVEGRGWGGGGREGGKGGGSKVMMGGARSVGVAEGCRSLPWQRQARASTARCSAGAATGGCRFCARDGACGRAGARGCVHAGVWVRGCRGPVPVAEGDCKSRACVRARARACARACMRVYSACARACACASARARVPGAEEDYTRHTHTVSAPHAHFCVRAACVRDACESTGRARASVCACVRVLGRGGPGGRGWRGRSPGGRCGS